MHIYPNSPNSSNSEESAATIIQAGFRGYRVRKQLKRRPINNFNIRNQREHQIIMASRNGSYINGNSTNGSNINNQNNNNNNHNHNNNNNNNNNDNDDNCDIEHKCATKIQANIRGYLVRKHKKREQEAATKIQASFRGFKTRKELQKIKQK